MFSRGYFPSEECQGRRVALQCYKQHGVGVRLWTGVKVAKDTRLLSFKVDRIFTTKKQLDKFRAGRGETWAWKVRNRYFVYNHQASSGHLVNQLSRSACNLVLKEPKGKNPAFLYLTTSCDVAAGSPLGLRYNSRGINRIIEAEQQALSEKKRDEERAVTRLGGRTGPMAKPLAAKAEKKRRACEKMAHARLFRK